MQSENMMRASTTFVAEKLGYDRLKQMKIILAFVQVKGVS